MVKVKEDLTGRRFGRLTVTRQTEDKIRPCGKHEAQWICVCSCDNKKIVAVGTELKRGHTTSCGCLRNEKISKANKKENVFDLDSAEYAIGYTAKGEKFWFDKEDYDLVKKYCWHYYQGYVMTNGEDHHKIYLHRLVMGVTDCNVCVDHIIHPPYPQHKIDNRKSNLRITTNQQNTMNRSLNRNNSSGVTGVTWDKKNNNWRAYIRFNWKLIHLGSFINKEDAIAARKAAEEKYFGEYAYKEELKGDNNERFKEN